MNLFYPLSTCAVVLLFPVLALGDNVTSVKVLEAHLVDLNRPLRLSESNGPSDWVFVANMYARQNGYKAGYSTFDVDNEKYHKLILFKQATFETVKETDLNNSNSEFEIGEQNSAEIWHRTSTKYAKKQGYLGAFPTFNRYRNGDRQIVVFGNKDGRLIKASEDELSKQDKKFSTKPIKTYMAWSRAVNRYAISKGCKAGIPSFDTDLFGDMEILCLH
jgi:hypothetical protein